MKLLGFLLFNLIFVSPLFAADSGAHHGPKLWILIVNAIVFFSFLFFVLRDPVKAFYKARKDHLKDEINFSQNALEAAELKLKAAQDLENRFSSEKEKIIANVNKETELEAEKIIAESKAQAQRVLEQNQKNLSAEEASALKDLQAKLAGRVCEAAKVELKTKFNASKDQEYRSSALNNSNFSGLSK